MGCMENKMETWQRDEELQESAANDVYEAVKRMREDIEAAQWVREHGGLEILKLHDSYFERLLWERNQYRALARKYEKVLSENGLL